MRLLLALVATVILAAPAAASERSEARALLAALEPEITLTPLEQEAIVTDYEARAAQVAATCMDDVRVAARKPVRTLDFLIPYSLHVAAAAHARTARWSADSRAALAAVRAASPVLRRAVAARARLLRRAEELVLAPVDFCAELAAWRAGGWKGRTASSARFDDVTSSPLMRRLERRARMADPLLRRAGATKRQMNAWHGEPGTPELREPKDPVVAEILAGFGQERETGGPGRTPSVLHPGL